MLYPSCALVQWGGFGSVARDPPLGPQMKEQQKGQTTTRRWVARKHSQRRQATSGTPGTRKRTIPLSAGLPSYRPRSRRRQALARPAARHCRSLRLAMASGDASQTRQRKPKETQRNQGNTKTPNTCLMAREEHKERAETQHIYTPRSMKLFLVQHKTKSKASVWGFSYS